MSCKGAWALCDDGCLKWIILIHPFELASSYKEIRLHEWLESMHKDMECNFGILNQLLRMLKSSISVQSLDAVDNIFKTCCVLHDFFRG